MDQVELCKWQPSLRRFLHYHQNLIEMFVSKKKLSMMSVKINGQDFNFSPGKYNERQKAIIEEFASNSACLYVGDTIEKDLVKNVEKLTELGFEITLHDKMPEYMIHLDGDRFLGT